MAYDYNIIANLDFNIRVSRFRVMRNEKGEELSRQRDILYAQAVLDMSDVEDMLENANAVAENVSLFYKEGSKTPDLTPDQLNQVRPAISEAVSTLIDNLTEPDFIKQHVECIKQGDEKNTVNRYIHTHVDGEYETRVAIMYLPDVLSNTLIYPARPGAIVNKFDIITL